MPPDSETMRRLFTLLLRALLARLDPQGRECPQQSSVVLDEEIATPVQDGGIVVVDYTACPSPQEIDSIENEFKELIDDLDLDECGESSPPSMMN
jgi:hypothetical protein